MSQKLSPPPRKRARNSSSAEGVDSRSDSTSSAVIMIHDSGSDEASDVCSTSVHKYCFKKGTNNTCSNGSNNGNGDVLSEHSEFNHSSDVGCIENVSSSGTSNIRKGSVPNSEINLSKYDLDIVRLIGQHLSSIGLKSSAEFVMAEAGCSLDQPTASALKRHVMNGIWSDAIKSLDDLRYDVKNPDHLVEMKFMLLEQKYLEYLAHGNSIEALKVLQNELTPLKQHRDRTHQLSTYLMFSNPDDLQLITHQDKNTNLSTSSGPRHALMDRLQSFLPASVMLPPRRLNTLISQAVEFQSERCLYHNLGSGIDMTGESSDYLFLDHQCSKTSFPNETLQILSDHCDEVWYCRFSPDGLKLATGSKDTTVIIWDFDPVNMKLRYNKTLEGHSSGVSFFAWSPDSKKLAVCCSEDCDEICLWIVETGVIDGKISQSTEDSLTTISWSPDGERICCGGNRGQFYQCDSKGLVLESWEGVRVQCVSFRKDGRSILAADTHHRIRSYSFEDLSDHAVLQEDHGIMTFNIDSSDRYALLNIATQGIHLWDLDSRTLVRKFLGITQGFYTLHSCFGGKDQSFIASGSEDSKVYIYHFKRDSPVAVLTGHSRTVTCVSWNPVYHRAMVSVSDDNSIRLWGPSHAKTISSNGDSTTP